MPDVRPAPYPPKTLAKGWRFELDYEQIERSDTWGLAKAEVRPWLLMMWFVAWKEAPCGSMPGDEEVIAGKIGMPMALWSKHRRVLLRGWWLADDGRLYHNTLADRVLEMLKRRRSDADRQATSRAAKKAADSGKSHPDVTRDKHVSSGGVQSESSTDHRLPTTESATAPPPASAPAPAPARTHTHEDDDHAHITEGHKPNAYGAIAWQLRRAGIGIVNSGHIEFRQLVDAGVTAEEFLAYVPQAKTKGEPFAYLMTVVTNARRKAKETADQLHQGPMPTKAPAAPAETFRERDERQVRERAAELTGRAPPAPGAVIDITPTILQLGTTQ